MKTCDLLIYGDIHYITDVFLVPFRKLFILSKSVLYILITTARFY